MCKDLTPQKTTDYLISGQNDMAPPPSGLPARVILCSRFTFLIQITFKCILSRVGEAGKSVMLVLLVQIQSTDQSTSLSHRFISLNMQHLVLDGIIVTILCERTIIQGSFECRSIRSYANERINRVFYHFGQSHLDLCAKHGLKILLKTNEYKFQLTRQYGD